MKYRPKATKTTHFFYTSIRRCKNPIRMWKTGRVEPEPDCPVLFLRSDSTELLACWVKKGHNDKHGIWTPRMVWASAIICLTVSQTPARDPELFGWISLNVNGLGWELQQKRLSAVNSPASVWSIRPSLYPSF